MPVLLCQGFGNTVDYDMDLIIPDPSLTLEGGAVDPWILPQYSWYYDEDFKPKARGKARLNILYVDLKAGGKRVRARPRFPLLSQKLNGRSTKCMWAFS